MTRFVESMEVLRAMDKEFLFATSSDYPSEVWDPLERWLLSICTLVEKGERTEKGSTKLSVYWLVLSHPVLPGFLVRLDEDLLYCKDRDALRRLKKLEATYERLSKKEEEEARKK